MSKRREADSKRVSPSTLRLLDANLNRCREGLRVLEDTARFVWNQGNFYRQLRDRRHFLDRIARKLYPELLRSRDSHQDEGRRILEGRRENISSVVAANFRRCEESLRVLEEYGKIFSASAGSKFKKIRFDLYEMEKNAVRQCQKN